MSNPDEINHQLLALLNEVAEEARERLPSSLRFNKEDRTQLVPVCIYCSIVEMFHGCMALIAAKQWTAIPAVLRSMLESYADIQAIAKDPGYWRHLHSTYLHERIKLGKKSSASHPFLGALHAAGDLDHQLRELKRELEDARKDKRGEISNWGRFNKAGLESIYDSIYWQLCMEGHNNLSALEDRHLEYEGDHFQVIAFRADWPDLRMYVDSMLVTLIGSSQTIHRMFATGSADVFDRLDARLGEIRKQYKP